MNRPEHIPPPRKPSARSRSLSRISSLRSDRACSATLLRRDRASPFQSARRRAGRVYSATPPSSAWRALAGGRRGPPSRPAAGTVRGTSEAGAPRAPNESAGEDRGAVAVLSWWIRRARPGTGSTTKQARRPKGAARSESRDRSRSRASEWLVVLVLSWSSRSRVSEGDSMTVSRSSRSRASEVESVAVVPVSRSRAPTSFVVETLRSSASSQQRTY